VKRFTSPRSEPRWRQAAFVVTHGVLGWGVTFAVVRFLTQSYRQNAWVGPREFVQSLIVFGVMGLVFGLLQFRLVERYDGANRCPECGEVLPTHTGWCRREEGRRGAA
jgi:hypothetical protein